MSKAQIRTTCPRDCYDACGMTVLVNDGVVRKVIGDRIHHVSRGALCGKCALAYNGVFIDPEQRLTTPLRRSGAKGAGSFEAVSWEQAVTEIAARLKAILTTRDPHTILHTHYTGTVSMIAGWFPIRFFNRLGATEVDPDTVCNKAGHAVLANMFGTSLTGFDPDHLPNAKTLLVWGANPSHSAPHMHEQWACSSKARVIVVDPIAHETARKADMHLQPRPGSDAALAFGLLNVIKQSGLIDRGFVARHVDGFDALEGAIDAASPQLTESLTGVPADLITAAGRQFASGPALLWLGQGMQRQPWGGNAFRAAALLSVVTGYLGRPGHGFCYMNGPETRGVDITFLMAPELRRDGGSSISHVDLADTLYDPDRSTALFTWNNNILASSPSQSKLRAALAREDLFTVVSDLFMTDTAAYADYVLPAASFLEFDDLVLPYFHDTISAQAQASAPLGRSLPNQDIFRRLAAAMGFQEPALYESDASILQKLLAQTRFKGSFEDLKVLGTVGLNTAPRVQFEGLKFATPSGKIEVRSARLKAEGQPEAPVPHADAAPARGRLRVLSPASAWLMNSSYGNDSRILQRLGEPRVFLNARELAWRGIKDGDAVLLRNETGALQLKAAVSANVPEGVALVYKGRWPSTSCDAANVNVLNPGVKTDIADSSAVHGVTAELVAL